MNRTGVVLFGWLGYTKEAGTYALAFNIASLALLPRMAVNALFAPMIAEFFARDDRVALQTLMNKGALWTSLGAAAIALPLLLLAEPMLGWFGHDFLPGCTRATHPVDRPGHGGCHWLPAFPMTMTGHEQAAAALLIFCAISNIAMTVFLITIFGLVGAAIANIMIMLLWNSAMMLFIWRKMT